jgi:cobalt/nickel transport system permease protein
MHIAEGALTAPVIAAGAAMAGAGIALGLRKMDYDRIPQVAVLSSAFFVASLVHVPLGLTSAHLILNGLCGVILGWAIFPALFVALLLQAILFGFGGITTLGVNTVVMALPGVACYYLFNRHLRRGSSGAVFGLGFAAGASAIALSAFLLGLSLVASSANFMNVMKLALVAHLPVMVMEGLVTGSIVAFLRKVRPELLQAPIRLRVREELIHA